MFLRPVLFIVAIIPLIIHGKPKSSDNEQIPALDWSESQDLDKSDESSGAIDFSEYLNPPEEVPTIEKPSFSGIPQKRTYTVNRNKLNLTVNGGNDANSKDKSTNVNASAPPSESGNVFPKPNYVNSANDLNKLNLTGSFAEPVDIPVAPLTVNSAETSEEKYDPAIEFQLPTDSKKLNVSLISSSTESMIPIPFVPEPLNPPPKDPLQRKVDQNSPESNKTGHAVPDNVNLSPRPAPPTLEKKIEIPPEEIPERNPSKLCDERAHVWILFENSYKFTAQAFNGAKEEFANFVTEISQSDNARTSFITGENGKLTVLFPINTTLDNETKKKKILAVEQGGFVWDKSESELIIETLNSIHSASTQVPGAPKVLIVYSGNPADNQMHLKYLETITEIAHTNLIVIHNSKTFQDHGNSDNYFHLKKVNELKPTFRKIKSLICHLPQRPKINEPFVDYLNRGDMRFYSYDIQTPGLTVTFELLEGNLLGSYSLTLQPKRDIDANFFEIKGNPSAPENISISFDYSKQRSSVHFRVIGMSGERTTYRIYSEYGGLTLDQPDSLPVNIPGRMSWTSLTASVAITVKYETGFLLGMIVLNLINIFQLFP